MRLHRDFLTLWKDQQGSHAIPIRLLPSRETDELGLVSLVLTWEE